MDLESLAARLHRLALERGLSVGTAESCTGGLIGHSLTAIAGSSEYYVGGVISYSNAVKMDLLAVRRDVLDEHGAVSEQVALAMARGARGRLACDYAVSVTGVAGPGGGTAAKPVGLTFVAAAGPADSRVRRHDWDGDRATNKRLSAGAALELLLQLIEEEHA